MHCSNWLCRMIYDINKTTEAPTNVPDIGWKNFQIVKNNIRRWITSEFSRILLRSITNEVYEYVTSKVFVVATVILLNSVHYKHHILHCLTMLELCQNSALFEWSSKEQHLKYYQNITQDDKHNRRGGGIILRSLTIRFYWTLLYEEFLHRMLIKTTK